MDAAGPHAKIEGERAKLLADFLSTRRSVPGNPYESSRKQEIVSHGVTVGVLHRRGEIPTKFSWRTEPYFHKLGGSVDNTKFVRMTTVVVERTKTTSLVLDFMAENRITV